MFNALNALSDESSLLTVGPQKNPSLIVAIMMSMSLHCVICYIPFFERIFNTTALSGNDWLLVFLVSFPVIIVDEI
jgi:Ca2+-transporting ATPase